MNSGESKKHPLATPERPEPTRAAFLGEFEGQLRKILELGGVKLVRGETSLALQVETSVGREELHEDRYMARYAQRF